MVTPHGAEFVVPGQQRVGVVSDISHAEIVQHVAGGQAEVGNGHKQELADGHGTTIGHPQRATRGSPGKRHHRLNHRHE